MDRESQQESQQSYSVGNSLHDEQHRNILRLCQAAANCLEGDRRDATARFMDILNDLALYATDHFRAEESILRDARYPLLERHTEEHLAYLTAIAKLLRDAKAGCINKAEVGAYCWSHS